MEWLAFLSITNYITAAFIPTSEHPGPEIKILYYCTQKAQPPVGDAQHDDGHQTRELTFVIGHRNTSSHL